MPEGVALRLQKDIPGGIILDQYCNVCWAYTRTFRHSHIAYR